MDRRDRMPEAPVPWAHGSRRPGRPASVMVAVLLLWLAGAGLLALTALVIGYGYRQQGGQGATRNGLLAAALFVAPALLLFFGGRQAWRGRKEGLRNAAYVVLAMLGALAAGVVMELSNVQNGRLTTGQATGDLVPVLAIFVVGGLIVLFLLAVPTMTVSTRRFFGIADRVPAPGVGHLDQADAGQAQFAKVGAPSGPRPAAPGAPARGRIDPLMTVLVGLPAGLVALAVLLAAVAISAVVLLAIFLPMVVVGAALAGTATRPAGRSGARASRERSEGRDARFFLLLVVPVGTLPAVAGLIIGLFFTPDPDVGFLGSSLTPAAPWTGASPGRSGGLLWVPPASPGVRRVP